MERIIDFFKNTPPKIVHILICMFGSIILGFPFGFGASIAIECHELTLGNKWDWSNFIAGLFGTILGSIVNFIILRELLWSIW